MKLLINIYIYINCEISN